MATPAEQRPRPRPRVEAAPASTADENETDARRALPSLDALLRASPAQRGAREFGRAVVKRALHDELDDIRADVAVNGSVPDEDAILARAIGVAARSSYGLCRVINATGVLLHTGLGRAPLPREAELAVSRAAGGYSDLEVDRETGGRGRRTSKAETLLTAITETEDALVVNNNAGALILTLAALAPKKDVLVSRGELIEIGGEFRLPDIMAASGARLVEVGTTNRTRAPDYQRALGRKTGLILKVHPSNYRVVGFAKTVPLRDLSSLAHGANVPLVFDVGSGLLDRYPEVPEDEPSVADALAGGADLVTFSGDKLLGGPQAGLVVGRRALVERLRRHPFARALRVDKLTVAALEAVLRLYATDRRADIPVWRMLATPRSILMDRARAMASVFKKATARESEAVAGGGALPGHEFPSAAVWVPVPAPDRIAARLRTDRPSVFCRVEEDGLVFDLRTVAADDDDRLVRAIRYALASP
jgi:L-seryl-tRNA(Ser) seleniumtransferase